jgi:hypothetical protein
MTNVILQELQPNAHVQTTSPPFPLTADEWKSKVDLHPDGVQPVQQTQPNTHVGRTVHPSDVVGE